MKGFWSTTWPIVLCVLGLAGSIFTITQVPGNITIPTWIFIFIVLIFISAIVIAYKATKTLSSEIIKGNRISVDEYNHRESIIRTEPSNSLRVDTLVTIYYHLPDQRAKKLGYGIVIYESPGEKNEIQILRFFDEPIIVNEIISGLKQNEKSIISNCYVLPNFYYYEAKNAYNMIEE